MVIIATTMGRYSLPDSRLWPAYEKDISQDQAPETRDADFSPTSGLGVGKTAELAESHKAKDRLARVGDSEAEWFFPSVAAGEAGRFVRQLSRP
jgi:hypothetical protein